MKRFTLSLVFRVRVARATPAWLLRGLLLGVGGVGLLGPAPGLAQSTSAQIQGTVTAVETGKGLESVTVVVSGPALQEFQSEVTDKAGLYVVAQLPPGDDYQVSFYFGADEKPRVVQSGIRLGLGKSITVNAEIKLRATAGDVKKIIERAPNVDQLSAGTGVEITQDFLRNTPVRGRDFSSLMNLAPGAVDVAPKTGGPGGDVGVQISGSTGNENNYIIDGLNTSDPNRGLIGTQLSQYFLREINILTSGYQAEFGRATGGVVSMSTQTGSNELHGSVFGSYQLPSLEPHGVARLGEALITRRKVDRLYDFGFELGGPIWKDRIWFYVGFAPTFQDNTYQLKVRTQSFEPGSSSIAHAAIDPDFECPAYLASQRLCDGPRVLAQKTRELDGSVRELQGRNRLYNGIAKLQFNFNPDHSLALTYIASPSTTDDYRQISGAALDSQGYGQVAQVHDGILHYIGKVLDRKLQLDVLYGYHYQRTTLTPNDLATPNIQWVADAGNPFSLADFENIADCLRQDKLVGGKPFQFNPCPITKYARGFGGYSDSTLQRHQLVAAATYFLHLTGAHNPLQGIHQIKSGFEFEDLMSDNFRTLTGSDLDPSNPVSGHRAYETPSNGTFRIANEYAAQNPDGTITHLNGFTGMTDTRNYSVYLRDSWNVGWVKGLLLNLGMRWEGQEVYGANGSRQIDIKDNWAPRLGIVYDFTQLTSRPGRGKLFFNYGRFYQSIPLNLNDRQFTGEGTFVSDSSSSCPKASVVPGGRPVPMPGAACDFAQGGTLLGGRYAVVAPGLKGQYIDEFVAGINYDVGLDVVLGASYVHRDLGNIIEDMSPDGGHFFIIGNPGVAADPSLVKQLEADVARLQPAGTAKAATLAQKGDYQDAMGRLATYKLVGTVFPKARRTYDALVLTLSKRLSHRFSLIGSYTYSRTMGNYPGTFSASNGQNDPNISSQFDLTDLLANRNGPLPTDRPHNIKLSGFFVQPVAASRGKLTIGLTFSGNSGRPIEVLGSHPLYGPREVFILPRGAGGRTPFVTQLDLHLGYEHKLSQRVSLSVFADAVNLLNQQAVLNVDDEYTTSAVSAIANGRLADLSHLKTNRGLMVSYNSNYGQPTAYQAPLYFRLGGRLSF